MFNFQFLTKFEKEVENKLGRSNIMGTQEYLLDKAKKEGQAISATVIKKLEAKAEVEKQKAEAEKLEAASKMLKNGFAIDLICDILGLTAEQLKAIK